MKITCASTYLLCWIASIICFVERTRAVFGNIFYEQLMGFFVTITASIFSKHDMVPVLKGI